MKGYAENAICPECRMYTRQQIVVRGVRKCECGAVFNIKNTTRVQRGKVIYPPFKNEETRCEYEYPGSGQVCGMRELAHCEGRGHLGCIKIHSHQFRATLPATKGEPE